MVYVIHAHNQFLPKMVLLYIQTLPLLPEEGSELDITGIEHIIDI
jgi:hypothetical protein